jgi:DNA-directed RNA polymerase specialized sigma24 family protein
MPAQDLSSEAALQRLAFAAARHDAAALAALARAVAPLLEAHARRALPRGPGAASDVVEEVVADVQAFLAAGDGGRPGWARFDARLARGGIPGWLYGIVRNQVRRRLRDARRSDGLRDDAAAAAPAFGGAAPPSPERALDGARALALVSALPHRERAALRLWLLDAPSREIAARLRFASPHAVDCCLSRGKQRLRRMLEAGERVAA